MTLVLPGLADEFVDSHLPACPKERLQASWLLAWKVPAPSGERLSLGLRLSLLMLLVTS